jgi:hypothetical protein
MLPRGAINSSITLLSLSVMVSDRRPGRTPAFSRPEGCHGDVLTVKAGRHRLVLSRFGWPL